MNLTKDGITMTATNPRDIARLKRAGYVEAKVGYPHPEEVVDGVKVNPTSKDTADVPAEPVTPVTAKTEAPAVVEEEVEPEAPKTTKKGNKK